MLSADETEWAALEAAREADPFVGLWKGCRPKFSDTPHEQSAYAHLPVRGITFDRHEATDATTHKRAIALWPELKLQNRAPIEKLSKPHPASYRPDLPLSGLGLEGSDPSHKWTLSALERTTLADRPVRYAVAEARQAAA